MDKIRIGIIGCGGMTNNHEKGFEQIKDQAIVTAVCDIDLERAKKAAEILHVDFVTTDYKEMVEHVDAVLCVLPHDLHYECGLFFARNKKHILMEKPLCNTEEECVRLIKACKDEGVVLMTAYPVRFWPGIIKLKEFMDSGEYGVPYQMSIWTEQYTEYPETHWASTSRLGGGQFFSHGCHYIDLLMWFLGEPEKGMHFGSNLGTPWMLKEGVSNATILFKNGTMGYHFGTWGAHGSKMGSDFQVLTTKGTLDYYWQGGEIRFYEGSPGNSTVLWDEGKELSKNTQYEMLHFIDCIKTGKKPITSPEASLEGLKVIWRMYDAEKHGKIADLSDIRVDL